MTINKGYLTAKTNKESDEYYTPKEAILPILEYLPKDKQITIWCPFDKEDSEYVKIFKANNFNVIFSHIDNNQNFFYYEPTAPYNFIISNPPFSCKDDVLKRLYELNKPFAVLFPLPTLQGTKRFKYLKGTQALIFNKRINFFTKVENHKIEKKGVAFASIYICKDFLPEKLIFKELK